MSDTDSSTGNSAGRAGLLAQISDKTKVLALICLVVEGLFLASLPAFAEDQRIYPLFVCGAILIVLTLGIVKIELTEINKPAAVVPAPPSPQPGQVTNPIPEKYTGPRLRERWKSRRFVDGEEILADWEMKRKGKNVTATVTTRQGPNAGREYKYSGVIRDSILTLTYVDTDKHSLDRGTLTLQLLENGMKLEGYLSFYKTATDRIDSCAYTCVAEAQEGES